MTNERRLIDANYANPTKNPAQTDRERLAQLIGETPDVKVWPGARLKITDHLIAHGVTFREDAP